MNFKVSPAEYIGIRDRTIAFYFDVECNAALIEYQAEQERQRFEATALGAIGGGTRLPEITSDNFRDQGL